MQQEATVSDYRQHTYNKTDIIFVHFSILYVLVFQNFLIQRKTIDKSLYENGSYQ